MFYIFLIFILLVWGVFAWRETERAILFLPVVFPAYLLKVNFFVPFTVLELLVYVTGLMFIVRWRPKELSATFKKFFWPILLFLMAATISVLIVPAQMTLIDGTVIASRMVALGIWKGWILAPLMFWFMLVNLPKKNNFYGLLFSALEVSGVFLGMIALYQVFTGDYLTPDGRASGPFTSANYLALYLAPIFVYLLIKLWPNDKQSLIDHGLIFVKKIFNLKSVDFSWMWHFLSLVVIGLALFFTKSYAAWIAVGFGLIFFYALSNRQPVYKKIIGLMAFFVLGASVFLTQVGSAKLASWFNFSERSSSSVRVEVWQVSLGLISQQPIFGLGLGQFSSYYNQKAVDILGRAPLEWEMLHPHNLFLAFWLSTGLLGLISFLWILKVAGSFFRKNDDSKILVLSTLTLLVVIIVQGFFDTPIWKNDLFMEFWLILGSLHFVNKVS